MQMRLALSLSVAVMAASSIATPRALAHQYEIFIDIDTEEDLYDLRVANQISDETLQTLVELYQRGLDVNTASREELYSLPNLTYAEVDAILAYREEVGRIANPVSLVAAGILDQDKLEAIAAFLIVRDPSAGLVATSGWARAQTRWSLEDEEEAPMAVQLRADTLRKLRVGAAAMLTHRRLGSVTYDPTRQALSAEGEGTRAHLPKIYAQWSDEEYSVIAGTYRIGFGQSLTFDNTDLIQPNGFYGDEELFRASELVRECKESQGELAESPCAGVAGDIYRSPDFRWRDGLLGAAASLPEIDIGDGHAATHAFVSYQPQSIYQYEIYSPEFCDDPRNDDDPACAAPNVYRSQEDDPLMPTSRFSFHTLPNMFAEIVGGGNVTYSPARRTHIGVTGYGAQIDWLVEGLELDFQEWSRYPFGGGYGAVGVDAAHGIGNTDFFAEVARSFDSMPDGGGGLGAIVRSVTSWDKSEVEASLRYYDLAFANPHARPISAADEFDGLRARDELGGRVRYTSVLDKRLHLRSNLDVWYSEEDRNTKLRTYVRGDIDTTDQLRWGLWAQYQDKGLADKGRDECYEVSVETDERGEPIPCAGQKLQLIGRMRVTPKKSYWFDFQYEHELLDEARYDDRFRQDISLLGIATAKPADRVRLRVRSRYRFEDISDNEYLEQIWWSYADFTYKLRQKDKLRLRYDLLVYLDDRASTATRTPSPEHWVWMEYEARF